MDKRQIGLGMLGIGVIGGQVAKVLTERAALLGEQTGAEIVLRKVKVLPADLTRPQAKALPAGIVTTDEDDFWQTPDMDIVIELIGGEHPALEYHERAIKAGKCVVSANKEVMAKHGSELLALAAAHGVKIRYEASVGGGIPLIAPFQRDLIANRINAIFAVINGTTNYILSRMSQENIDFATTLAQAQKLGYAEARPENDIEGMDAAYKLAILATLAFKSRVRPDQIYREGISRLSARDFQYARELGFAIKLLAVAKQTDDAIEARVHPAMLPKDSFLARINGVYNAVLVDGDLTGQVTFSGKGAGPLPTSSAVIADIIQLSRDILCHNGNMSPPPAENKKVKQMDDIITKYYIRLTINDQPGVLAQIAGALGEYNISIASAIQKEADASTGMAEIVIMTHPAQEKNMQQALKAFRQMTVVKELNNFVRVEA